jgi:hypothetical protein
VKELIRRLRGAEACLSGGGDVECANAVREAIALLENPRFDAVKLSGDVHLVQTGATKRYTLPTDEEWAELADGDVIVVRVVKPKVTT